MRTSERAPRHLAVALILSALVAAGGCAGERSGLRSTAKEAWTFRGHALLSAVPSEPESVLLVAAESPQRVVALDAASGRELWTVEAGGRNLIADGGVTLAQAAATFTRDAAEVVALDTRTGAELWRTSRWRAYPAPWLRAGMAIGLTVDRTYEAVDARTGERIFAVDPAPKIPPSDLPPYRDDRGERDGWGPAALTGSGRLAYRGPGAALVVVDFRTKTVSEIAAPEMGERRGIVALGEQVVVVGTQGSGRDSDSYLIQGFDLAAGTLTCSKRVAGRTADGVEAGPKGAVLILDSAARGDQRRAARVFDATTGEEPSPESYDVPGRSGPRCGGPFGDVAVYRVGPRLTAFAVPGWRRVWEADTGDPDDDDRQPIAAASGVVFMKTDTTTTRYGGSFVSESRITAFDLGTGALLWRYVGDDVRDITAIGTLAIGVGSDRIVALPLRP